MPGLWMDLGMKISFRTGRSGQVSFNLDPGTAPETQVDRPGDLVSARLQNLLEDAVFVPQSSVGVLDNQLTSRHDTVIQSNVCGNV